MRDPHGFQGVDVEDVEAAAPVHQHLGQAHVADDGVDDERVAPKSRDAGRMVILIENDGRGRPLQLSGNRTRGSTYLAKSHLLLSPGAFVLQAADDDQAPVHVQECSFRQLLLVLVDVGLFVTAVAIGLGCPSEEALHHITIFKLVVQRVAMVGAWLLQELVEVIVSRRVFVLAPGLNKPTGPVKPARSGSGLPDRFDRKPVKFKIKFKIACSIGSDRLTGQFDRFTDRFD